MVVACASPGLLAQAPPAERPRLIVLLSVDQMRADYVQRYGHEWTGGLRRLLDGGAVFTQAAYPYLGTLTCAGHSTISTGNFPARHGMIQNTWWDRETSAIVGCTADPKATTIGYMKPVTGAGNSLWRLNSPTFADELRGQQSTPPKIVAVSLKERTALTMAGRKADAVVWFDNTAGWATSSAYTSTKVPFVEQFIAANPVAAFRSKVWTPALPAAAYTFADDQPGEVPTNGYTRRFPHALSDGPATTDTVFYERFTQSPFADEYLAKMATAAVDALKMGRGPGTDMVAISFSVLDVVGHDFGPKSQEIEDVLMRLDRTLGQMFAALDRQVGRGRYVVALSADHGVAPFPEEMKALGIDAGRVNMVGLRERLQQELVGMFGDGKHLANLYYTDIHFAPGVYERLRADRTRLDRIKALIAAWPGVDAVFEAEELQQPRPTGDRRLRAAALSYFRGRSGDLVMVPRPYWITVAEGTTHGSAASYDQRVPLMLMGPGIARGTYHSETTPADIAPTLALLSGITMADADGRVLREALATGGVGRHAAAPAGAGAGERATAPPTTAPSSGR
jgi:predicted AlkP superfamily pyrophosphatase or phosphodiesterase